MKVTALASLYRPHVGGVETMIEEMHHSLVEAGHDMNVIAKQWPDELPEHESINGVNITRLASPDSDEAIIDLATELRDRGDLLDKADVLHIVGMRRPLPLFGVLLAYVHRKPVVGSIVGSEVPHTNAPHSQVIWDEGAHYMADAYKNMSDLTAVSASTRDFALTVMPELSGQISVLPVGIAFDRYKSIEPIKVDGIDNFLFCMRRLEHSKGVDVLIEAYADLKSKSQIDIPLVIAGDGPERNRLQKLSRQMGLDDNSVRFIGSVSLDQGIGLLKTATLTIVPSRAEGGGLINTEANAVGCPLVTSNTGGIHEYTTYQAALFTQPEDIEGIASAIVKILSDDALRNSLVENGKEFAATRDWSNLINRYIRLYEQATELSSSQLQVESKLGKKVIKILSNEV